MSTPSIVPQSEKSRVRGKVDVAKMFAALSNPDFRCNPATSAARDAYVSRLPEAPEMARAQRAFTREATRYMVDEGRVPQLLEIGVGYPDEPMVHQVAWTMNRSTTTTYVDVNTDVVIAIGSAYPDVDVVRADVKDAIRLLDAVSASVRLDEPVGVLLVGFCSI